MTIDKEQLREALDSFENHGLTDELDYKDETVYKAAKEYLTALDEGRVVKWRSMDSAPKDGTSIMVHDFYETDWVFNVAGRYNQTGVDGYGVVQARFDDKHGWVMHQRDGNIIKLNNPISWCPYLVPRKPKPPTTERED